MVHLVGYGHMNVKLQLLVVVFNHSFTRDKDGHKLPDKITLLSFKVACAATDLPQGLTIVQHHSSGLGGLIVDVSRSHTQLDVHPAGLVWTTDQLVADVTTYTIHNKHNRRTSVPSAEFEPAAGSLDSIFPALQVLQRFYNKFPRLFYLFPQVRPSTAICSSWQFLTFNALPSTNFHVMFLSWENTSKCKMSPDDDTLQYLNTDEVFKSSHAA